jgi:hypothetical protein
MQPANQDTTTEETPVESGLTQEQKERAAFLAAHSLLQNALDNHEELGLPFEDFLPMDWVVESSPEEWDAMQKNLRDDIEKIMSNLFEEAGKRDK